jgi:hypothetical protein
VTIIAVILLVVNVVEAALPQFPGWMRVDMTVTALLMLLLAGLFISRLRGWGERAGGRGCCHS